MKVLVLDEADVHRLLPMDACIEAMADVLAALARGEALQPLRSILKPAGAPGLMASMPAWRGGPEAAFGVKVVGVFPGNVAQGLDAHQGAVLLFSGETGEPLAFVNASAVTAIRTAAVSGVATRAARPRGRGRPRPRRRERAGGHPPRGDGLRAPAAPGARGQPRPGARPRLRGAARGRFAVPRRGRGHAWRRRCGARTSWSPPPARPTPVLRREWVAPGAHLNVIGASLPDRREVDGATVAAASPLRGPARVDRERGRRLPAGPPGGRHPRRAHPGRARRGAGGPAPGRTSRDEITLFKSLGLAVEDLAAAALVYRRAREAGGGHRGSSSDRARFPSGPARNGPVMAKVTPSPWRLTKSQLPSGLKQAPVNSSRAPSRASLAGPNVGGEGVDLSVPGKALQAAGPRPVGVFAEEEAARGADRDVVRLEEGLGRG